MKAGKLIPFPHQGEAAPTDSELLAACGRRDMRAMGLFFDRHQRSIYRFLDRLYPSAQADVDDWVHATFITAMESAPRFREGSEPRTWLFGIALNIARQHVRKEGRRRLLLRLLWNGGEALAPSPDEALQRRQDQQRLRGAIASLNDHQRAAFVLCDLEELSGKEAAAVAGTRPGTLGRRLFEARRELRRMLREDS
jgi:RNA polymerase sigma-70 factor (ECF subfamily)